MNILSVKSRVGQMFLSYYVAEKCGHETRRRGKISAGGRTITMSLPKNEDGSVDYCFDCLQQMAVSCAWCGKPIFVADSVTLDIPEGKHLETPKRGVVYRQFPIEFVGCLRPNCADGDAEIAGVWMPDENGQGHLKRGIAS